ncbi:hypothetical protein BpHYR1_006904 [Brachionus plicatilis]|uniref:J domain-containing protein n=1 Tax=Brachionus plicatilis TaxID=10195 RepID=A0A3M7QRW2_BRAPC|nr:hypothetical protein BpHYR1_006904 [Brachionus plicatilis]
MSVTTDLDGVLHRTVDANNSHKNGKCKRMCQISIECYRQYETLKFESGTVNSFSFSHRYRELLQPLQAKFDTKIVSEFFPIESRAREAFEYTALALTLIPIENIKEAFDIILAEIPIANEKIMAFIQYFKDQWLNGTVSPEIWNHFNSQKRTNNDLEGFHSKLSKLSKFVPKHHPKLAELIRCLKKDDAKTRNDYYQTDKKNFKQNRLSFKDYLANLTRYILSPFDLDLELHENEIIDEIEFDEETNLVVEESGTNIEIVKMYNSFKSVNFVGDLEARFKECPLENTKRERIKKQIWNDYEIPELYERKRSPSPNTYANRKAMKNEIKQKNMGKKTKQKEASKLSEFIKAKIKEGERKFKQVQDIYINLNYKQRRAILIKEKREKWEKENRQKDEVKENQEKPNNEQHEEHSESEKRKRRKSCRSKLKIKLPTGENCSEILELKEDFTLATIRNQYVKLSLKYHPDKGNYDGERMKLINAAYKKLKNLL